MANDEDLVGQMRLHQECWELLPWVVNGRLSSTDAARIKGHLQECARCSEELHAQQQLCEALRAEDPVLLAPQASLKKMWQRFEAESPSMEGTPVENLPPPAPPRVAASGSTTSGRVRFALAAQALVIVGLLSWMTWQTQERRQAPLFVTLSSPESEARRAAVRIVFAPRSSIDDMAELLRSVDAQVLAGPNTAGAYTLGLPAHHTPQAVSLIAGKLRSDPRVQFAEALVGEVQP